MASRRFKKQTPAQIAKAAKVTPEDVEDIERAKAFVAKHAPKGAKDLLEAGPVEDEETLDDV